MPVPMNLQPLFLILGLLTGLLTNCILITYCIRSYFYKSSRKARVTQGNGKNTGMYRTVWRTWGRFPCPVNGDFDKPTEQCRYLCSTLTTSLDSRGLLGLGSPILPTLLCSRAVVPRYEIARIFGIHSANHPYMKEVVHAATRGYVLLV